MQPGCVGHYSGLVCGPQGLSVHLSRLVEASGELGIDGTLSELLLYMIFPRQGPGPTLYHVQLIGFLVFISLFHG